MMIYPRDNPARTILTLLIILSLTLGIYHPLQASVGRSGADFLQLPAGARATGVGGAFATIADDALAPFWNPAGINQLERTAVGISHQEGFYQVQNEVFSYVRPLGLENTLAITGRFQHIEGEERDVTGERLGSFTDYGLAGGGYYAWSLGDWNAGVGLQGICQQLGGEGGATFAFDGGILGEFLINDFPLKTGISFHNIGPDMELISQGDPLPRTYRGGVSTDLYLPGSPNLPQTERNTKLTLAGNVSYMDPESTTEYSLGTELNYDDFLFLRAGWHDVDDEEVDSNFSLGLGLSHQNVRADYSWSESDLLGDKHLISLNMEFGRTRKQTWRPELTYWEQRWGGQTTGLVSGLAGGFPPLVRAVAQKISGLGGEVAEVTTRVEGEMATG